MTNKSLKQIGRQSGECGCCWSLANIAALLIPFVAWGARVSAADPSDISTMDVRTFAVRVGVDDGGEEIHEVALWFTHDDGTTWERHSATANEASPAMEPEAPQTKSAVDGESEEPIRERTIVFEAPDDGVYGFFAVATNDIGSSTGAPVAGTTPQLQVLVDSMPPTVRLEPPSVGISAGQSRIATIRWAVSDANLDAQPVELEFRRAGDAVWRVIENGQPSRGQLDWPVPDDMDDDLVFRASARDRVGHTGAAESSPILVPSAAMPQNGGRREDAATDTSLPLGRNRLPGATTAFPASDRRDSERATTLYNEARTHIDRGEFRLATSRLRESLALDPERSDALVELGGALYAQRLLTEATGAYRLALSQDPKSRSALQGLALVHVAEHRFPEAVEQLTAIVRAQPRDVEAWLYLGDVAIYQGDELLAREHYQKASTLDPRATDIIEKAQLRLGSLQRLAAGFRQVDPTP